MKILVIQQKMIGDVLTSSILFEALRDKYPEAELHFMIYPHTAPVVENNPFINHIIYYPDKELKNPFRFISFLKKIRKQQYDVVIDVYSKIGSGLISFFSGAKVRTGYKKWYTRWCYSKSFRYAETPETEAGLAVENRLLLLSALSSDFPLEIKPKIYLTEAEIGKAREQLHKEGIDFKKPLFMIGVLGSSLKKTYPLAYMAKILDHLAETTEAQFLFNYIPKQKKEVLKLYELCKEKTRKKIFIELFGSSLREFIALTSLSDALIGNEGGAVNMAKAVNTPTFSIFAPQIEKNAWSLYEDEHNVAVHLKDFLPAAFEEDSPVKDRIDELYEDFGYKFILPKLDEFINNLKLNKNKKH
ncbi:glycosyltransferase family 9 protein [Salegentibacter chungangensis]|uniref:Glycosyltransferase family 9 protein n=1 Tax=Salegentibacter chungangensis TaxID=1335724 RepID=A0ABW3NR81_9FLAO